MIINIDILNKTVIHNNKAISIDLFTALQLAPNGTSVKIVKDLDTGFVQLEVKFPKENDDTAV